MRTIEKTRNLFFKSKVTVRSELDDTIMADTFEAFEKFNKTQSAAPHLNIWRIIMKSRITKITAAAVIIIALLISISQIFGPVSVTSSVFAGMIDAMKKKPWLHIVMESGTGQFEVWISFESQLGASKWSSGKAKYLDGTRELSYTYDPVKKSITVSEISPAEITKGAESVGNFWQIWLKKMSEAGMSVTEKTGMFNGKKSKIYEVKGTIEGKTLVGDKRLKDFCGQIIADMQENLPVFAQQELFDTDGNLIKEKKFYFDYPASGPKDIYALGVPDDAKVVHEKTKPVQPLPGR